MGDEEVRDVSDTALLAAGWRAMESERPDAVFHDPLAARLAGERGLRIARSLPDGAWVVAMRTPVIDSFLSEAISAGSDTIIDIGAGMDARPYRMDLPSSLRWIEIDDPSFVATKNDLLRGETPRCSVERVGLDLTDRGALRELFDGIGRSSGRSTALTEGVIGYLDVEDVAALADDLHALSSCELWVTEYFSTRLLRAYQKHQPLASAPVRFNPDDWTTFFAQHGWAVAEISYLGERSRLLHRPVPLTLRDRLIGVFTSRPLRDMGYALLERIV
jgi:methyltransferase (TIGR00027 family)